MDERTGGRPRPTRRRFLRGTVGVATGLAATDAATAATAPATPTVLTRNMYLGVDLSRLLEARSLGDVRRITGESYGSVDQAAYEARAEAMAGEIQAAEADVVALQEAGLFRVQRPGDFGEESATEATAVVVDFLDLLESALASRGLEYDVAVSTVTTDLELPADTSEGQVDVRVTDRDALLVRGGIDTGETRSARFEASQRLPVPGSSEQIVLRRGYCAADLAMDDAEFTVASTHLESVSETLRRQQARELADGLPADRPVVVGGDFNSGPDHSPGTYTFLTETFADAFARLRPDGDGFTCCQGARLTNDRSQLDRRVDAVLYRGGVRPTAVSRVGHRPDDRVAAQVDGETVRVWPSDHAGVVATFELGASTPTGTTPTPTPVQTPTPATDAGTHTSTPTPSPGEDATTPTPGDSGPGFGPLAAVVGVGIGVLSRVRGDRE